jgi:alpha-galactosidase
MSPEALKTLTNAEVIAVDQDQAGKQGDRGWSQGPLEIWARDLKDGSKVVGLFNRNAGATEMTLDLKMLGVEEATSVRDLWQHAALAPIRGMQTFVVPRHGVVLLRIVTKKSNSQSACGSGSSSHRLQLVSFRVSPRDSSVFTFIPAPR